MKNAELKRVQQVQLVRDVQSRILANYPHASFNDMQFFPTKARFQVKLNSKTDTNVTTLTDLCKPGVIKQYATRDGETMRLITEYWVVIDFKNRTLVDAMCDQVLWLALILLAAGFGRLVFTFPQPKTFWG